MASGVIYAELLVRAQEENLLGIKQGLALVMEHFGPVQIPAIDPTEQEGIYKLLAAISSEEAKLVPVKRTLESYVGFYRDLKILRIHYQPGKSLPQEQRRTAPDHDSSSTIEQLNCFTRR